MRFFQPQILYNAFDNPPPPQPPFLTDQEEEKSLSLLRESTTHLREGRQRLPTPDRVAIMDLSSSFEKRRLGKQQQILTEITQRCREQEVTDLSSKLTAKVDLKKERRREQDDSPPFLPTSKMPHRRSVGRFFSEGSLSTGDLRDLQNTERRRNFEKSYKFFPARRIIRQASRTGAFQTTGSNSGAVTSRDVTTRVSLDFLKGVRNAEYDSRTQILEQQTFGNGSLQLHHFTQPNMDAQAPLHLPNLPGPDSSSYHDRIDCYFSSSRAALNPRSRSFYDASSVSGRSFRSLQPGSRHQMKSMRSMRSEAGQGALYDHVTMPAFTIKRKITGDIKSSVSGFRPDSHGQRVSVNH